MTLRNVAESGFFSPSGTPRACSALSLRQSGIMQRPYRTKTLLLALALLARGKVVSGDQLAPGADAAALDTESVHRLIVRTRSSGGGMEGPLGLRFDVLDRGYDRPWLMAIVNRGNHAVDVVFDASVFWFEVTPPKRKGAQTRARPVRCRLPKPLFPSSAQPESVLRFEPGEGAVEAMDPRLYCSPTLSALVPGALIQPHFGWPERLGAVGRRAEGSLESEPPFVARRASAAVDSEKSAPPARAVKQLVAAPFELPASYGGQSEPDARDEPALELEMISGSDAATKRQAAVTVSLHNRSRALQRVFFRREHLTFTVKGPGTVLTCDPEPDQRSPSSAAFRSLPPGRSLTVTSRLYELCPRDTFARRGTYLVYAYFDSAQNGAQWGYSAFTGRIFSRRPALVRVLSGRTGEAVPRSMLRIRDE